MQHTEPTPFADVSFANETTIRRKPQPGDDRLALAIAALHRQGPSLVCDLWERLEALEATASPASSDARTEAKRLVDRLRG